MNISRSPRSRMAFTLIELLVVIAIIAILASLGLNAMGTAQVTAKKAQAKNDMSQITGAVQAYYTEYGRYPAMSGTTDTVFGASATLGNEQIVSVLRYKTVGTVNQATLDTNNPRQIKFIEPKVTDMKKGCVNSATGVWYDPWGTQYLVFIDADYAGDIDGAKLGFTATTKPQVGVGTASVGYYYVKAKTNPQPDFISGTLDYSANKNTILLSWQ